VSLTAVDWHSLYGWVVIGLFSGVISFLACNVALAMARSAGMLAVPGHRQSHTVATPTGGGLGILFSLVLTTLCLQPLLPLPGFWWSGVLPGVVVLGVVGWRDDRQSVSPLLRLFVQLAVSIWLLGFSTLQFSWNEAGWLIAGVVAMVWSMNLYNFMDGSDGMAGVQGVFAGLVIAVLFHNHGQVTLALLALALAAACAGFVLLNFPPARVFMGDVASVPLGFIIAALCIYGIRTGILGLHAAILVMAVFIVDATLTLLARVIRGEQWYTAHAQHVYQRLIVQGWSHRRVLVVYQAINLTVVLPAIVLTEKYPQKAMLTSGLTLLILAASWYLANRRLGMLAKVQKK
jgi:Fuc2NAc and GlcNAc transferase